MNDREYVENIFAEIFAKLKVVVMEYNLEEISFILAKNQNLPPLGEADGSFTPEQWSHACGNLRILQDLK